MAKQITQETFDAVVKENVEEFEMSTEEAIDDAIKQFEAQGINLANIVKTVNVQENGGDVSAQHPVVKALEELAISLKSNPLNHEDIAVHCSIIQKECDIDISHRCLASKNNGYAILLDGIQITENNNNALLACLKAMCSLCDGQPDVLNMAGIMVIMEKLKNQQLPNDIVESLVKLVRLTCVMHEDNRQAYVSHDVIPTLIAVLETHKDNAKLVKEVCAALRVLTNDDDVRVPFGKAHEHAKMIVTEADALSKILRICKDYSEDYSVLGELFLTLARLAVRNEFCQEIMELGGLSLMLTALEKSMSQKSIVLQALNVMKAIAGNDQVKVAIVKSGGANLILEAISKHPKNPAICEVGCSAIATIVLRNPDHCQVVIEAGGPNVLVKTMTLHPTQSAVQKQASMAVRNLVARTRQYCPIFLELGVEALLQKALATHKDLQDEAKAALRDLGCKVELKTPWTGEGKGIHH